MKYSALILTLAIIGLSLLEGTGASDLVSLVAEQNDKLNDLLSELEHDFRLNTVDFFFEYKSKLAQPGVEEQLTREAVNVLQIATMIESIRFAILKKAILATKDTINDRFTITGQGYQDIRRGVVILPQLLPVFVSRALLRAYGDGSRYVDYTWSGLHLVIEHDHQANRRVIELAKKAYEQRAKFLQASRKAANEFSASLANALAELNIHQDNSASMIAVLDRIISEAMGCMACRWQSPNGDYYNTVTMFEDDKDIEAAVDLFVDKKLQHAFRPIKGVYMPDVEAQAQVTQEDVDRLMSKIVA